MIVSASRRTDLPALYSQWLRRRVAAGHARVRNPFNPKQLRDVNLRPAPGGGMDALVLWTRNPAPLLPDVPTWEDSGVRSLWLVTVTGYPAELEPAAPPTGLALGAVRGLAARLGPQRVVWRYDPILVVPERGLDSAWHLSNFDRLAGALSGSVHRCIVSRYDTYRSARVRLRTAGWEPSAELEREGLLRRLAEIAVQHGIGLQSCCEDLQAEGVDAGACIDAQLLHRLWQLDSGRGTDPGQRPGCRCALSVDIGAYDTCTHGCLYCYATRSPGKARRNHATHDPLGEELCRPPQEEPRGGEAVAAPHKGDPPAP